MKNGPKFFNNILRCHSSRHYNHPLSSSTRNNNESHKKFFFKKTKYGDIDEKNHNNRYTNKYFSNSKLSPSIKKNNNRKFIYKSIEINKVNNNEKSCVVDKSNFEYNAIIALLDEIMHKYNSYDILIKIKNFINDLMTEINEKKFLMKSESCGEFVKIEETKNFTNKSIGKSEILFNDKYGLTEKNTIKNTARNKKIKFNEKIDNSDNNIYLNRHVKKLYHKINQLEEKSNIEQLKYLFFIVEQEKKISELEKNFEMKEIPLDKRIIEKMKELKCFPDFIRTEFDIKKHSSFPNEKTDEKNNITTTLKSRNKKELKKKYSFDKDIEPISKNNQSSIKNQCENKIRSKKFQFPQKNIMFNSKNRINKNISPNYSSNEYKIKKYVLSFSKPVNQFFHKKKFFVTHPRLSYVKDSIEKNHFLKLKTKEQLSGESNLLSKMNLASKSQKIAVNDFSSFINNSMINFEKLKKN